MNRCMKNHQKKIYPNQNNGNLSEQNTILLKSYIVFVFFVFIFILVLLLIVSSRIALAMCILTEYQCNRMIRINNNGNNRKQSKTSVCS